MAKERENWIDYVKGIACVLVAMGHLFQSMIAANLAPSDGILNALTTMFYYFHVPVFFAASGYLHYKHYDNTHTIAYIKKKFISLGVPYVVFSLVTILINGLFSGKVNRPITGPVWELLLIHPISPYWFLYVLFFVCLFVVLLQKTGVSPEYLVIMTTVLYFVRAYIGGQIYLVDKLFENAVWFAFGMLGAKKMVWEKITKTWLISSLLFIIGVVMAQSLKIELPTWARYAMALLGMIGLVSTLKCTMPYIVRTKWIAGMMNFISRYSFEIYLMHTIFAAGCRIVLLQCGINNLGIHLIVGLIASIVFPALAINIMGKIPYATRLVYPLKPKRIMAS